MVKKEVKNGTVSNAKQDSAATTTEKAGITYVSAYSQPFHIGDIDAAKVYELQENTYIAGSVSQMVNMILSGEISISVYDDKDDVVEDVSRELNRMFSTQKCNLSAICRTAINDLFVWGISIFNWVWSSKGGKIVCEEVNHLDSYTFRNTPVGSATTRVYGRLLPGIYYDRLDDEIHYVQLDSTTGQWIELAKQNLFVVRDPSSHQVDGNSVILPVAQIADFSNYAWNTLGQQMFRTGAPIMFIKISNPMPGRTIGGQYIEGDVEYANKILANWGKDTPYVLRENMEVINVGISENALSIRALDKSGEMIRDYISPSRMLGKDGTLISGNNDATLRLVNNNIKGWIGLLRSQLREFPNYYLRANSYPESWHAEVNIPSTQIEDMAGILNLCNFGFQSKTMTFNEIREKLGLEGISDEEIQASANTWALTSGGSMFVPPVSEQNVEHIMFSEGVRKQTSSAKRQQELARDVDDQMNESTEAFLRGIVRGLRKAEKND